MTRLRETNDGLYDNMLRLFEQRCVGHTRPLDDDEALSSIGGMCFGVENDCTLSSSNFQQYVESVVKKQFVVNYQDILPHVLPAFQQVANVEADACDHDVLREILAGLKCPRIDCQVFVFIHMFYRQHCTNEIIDVWKSFSKGCIFPPQTL